MRHRSLVKWVGSNSNFYRDVCSEVFREWKDRNDHGEQYGSTAK